MKKLIIPALFFTLSFSAIANVEIPRISAPAELITPTVRQTLHVMTEDIMRNSFAVKLLRTAETLVTIRATEIIHIKRLLMPAKLTAVLTMPNVLQIFIVHNKKGPIRAPFFYILIRSF